MSWFEVKCRKPFNLLPLSSHVNVSKLAETYTHHVHEKNHEVSKQSETNDIQYKAQVDSCYNISRR